MKNKLDFLMTLTGTRNSVLSKAISFDPSYISRIRTGSRSLPRTPQFADPVAAYFSRNLRTESQKLLLRSEICPGEPFPETPEALQEAICRWLISEDIPAPDSIGNFILHFSSMAVSGLPVPSAAGASSFPEELKKRIEALEETADPAGYYYGNNGKREAVELFLGKLCLSGRPHSLLLFSDEDMSWLYEDPAFAARWAAMLFHLLKTGSTIQIPHNITRSSEEMFAACQNWLPLYMTGAISPWYCPIPRDGIYRRSLFIAAGHSALISSSVRNLSEGMLNLLIDDRTAIRALEAEFRNFLNLCRPLMHVHNAQDIPGFFRSLRALESEPCSIITAQPIPSFFTMPHAVIRSILKRHPLPELSLRHQSSCAGFRNVMRKGFHYTEVIHLPSPEQVKEGRFRLPMCDLFGEPDFFLTPEDLTKQLLHAIHLLLQEPAYHIILSERIPDNVLIHVQEGGDALLTCAQPPTTAFAITQRDMSAALYRYIRAAAEAEGPESREKTIRRLREYIRKLN